MAGYISPKKSVIRFLFSFGAAAGTAALLNFFLSKPLLGPHYDFLMRYRPAPPVSRELTIIETGLSGDIIEPAVAASVVMVLIEMDASALVIQTPVLGSAAGGKTGKGTAEGGFSRAGPEGDALLDRLDDEFTLLEGNILNLFRAIRTGSVAPGESERYVEDLLGLAERGKERLVSAIEKSDTAGIELMEKASAAFGNIWEAGDLWVPVIRGKNETAAGTPGEEERGVSEASHCYATPRPDWDGVLRRVAPVLLGETEHVAYALLKTRYDAADIGFINYQPVLTLKKNGNEVILPLDARGAILTETPRGEDDFKRVSLETFLEYERLDQELYRSLGEAEKEGLFAYLAPEAYPGFRYDYAGSLREELLENPAEAGRGRWLDTRREYFSALEDFVYGPSETDLVTGYETLIASETLGPGGIERLVSLRDGTIKTFARIREQYETLKKLREQLSAALEGSICILGPVSASPEGNPSDAEASAILANSILTGQAVVPLASEYVLLWSLIAVLFAVFLLRRLGPFGTLLWGCFFIILIGGIFSLGFIFTKYWIDPLIPAGAAAAGVFPSFLFAVYYKNAAAKALRRVYGPIIAPVYLKRLIRAGGPAPGMVLKARAAVVAIRRGDLFTAERRKDPLAAAEAALDFREAVCRVFKKAGGVIVGTEGDTVLVAFGSPPERLCISRMKSELPYEDDINARSSHSPAAKAVGCILDFLPFLPEAASWCFGIDTGECAFRYSALSGYSAFGYPVIRSRILASLTSRYKARILVTDRVSDKIDGLLVRSLDVLTDRAGKEREPFYEVLAKGEAPVGSPGSLSRL
jgi:class 3 adenylate cyclase